MGFTSPICRIMIRLLASVWQGWMAGTRNRASTTCRSAASAGHCRVR